MTGPIGDESAVQCRAGFTDEAVTLGRNLGTGTLIETFPTLPPPAAASADCIVALGK